MYLNRPQIGTDCKYKNKVLILQEKLNLFPQNNEKMKKRKVIQLPHGNVQKLMKAMGCSHTSVYDALCGNTNSEMAAKIRKEALTNYGGVEVYKVYFVD